jgi:hypothetical protein
VHDSEMEISARTYHGGLPAPPLVLAGIQGVHNDVNGIANEGTGGCHRQPAKHELLRMGDVVVDLALDEVAGGIRGWQRLASGAECGGLGDIGVGVGGDDAARGEGDQEEQQHDSWVRILEYLDRCAQGVGRHCSISAQLLKLGWQQFGHGTQVVWEQRGVAAGGGGGGGGGWRSE